MGNQSVGFIGGGQMALALVSGGIQAKMLNPTEVMIAEPSETRRDLLKERLPGVVLVESLTSLLPKCDQIVLSVKPNVLRNIAAELSKNLKDNHLVVSIAAGISIEQLQFMLGTQRVIRVMPNTPAQIGVGAAAIAVATEATEADMQWTERLMNSVGTSVRVADELMHAVTAVSGSSPAYLYLVIEAMSDGGVAAGLPRNVATQLAAQAVLGAAQMVLQTGLHPGQLKDQVTSPGGTTLAALRELEAGGVRSAFIEAVAACVERSQELEANG